MLGLLAGGTQAIALDTTGLVGAWLLDDGNGQTLKDSSDNGLNGEIVKGKPKWVKGKFDGGLEFGGSDMAQVPDDKKLDLKSFTIAAWVNIPKISGKWQIIASKENRGPQTGITGCSATSIPMSSTTHLRRTAAGNLSMPKPLSRTENGIMSLEHTRSPILSCTSTGRLMPKSRRAPIRTTTITSSSSVGATLVITG